jgi:hypothetical protein
MRRSNRLRAASSHHWAATSFWCLSGPFGPSFRIRVDPCPALIYPHLRGQTSFVTPSRDTARGIGGRTALGLVRTLVWLVSRRVKQLERGSFASPNAKHLPVQSGSKGARDHPRSPCTAQAGDARQEK